MLPNRKISTILLDTPPSLMTYLTHQPVVVTYYPPPWQKVISYEQNSKNPVISRDTDNVKNGNHSKIVEKGATFG